MSGHRWIRRLDGTVWLFISGVHCGTLMKRLGGSWSANYATGEDIGQKDGPSTKASAKRALLRAVMAPKTKTRNPEVPPVPLELTWHAGADGCEVAMVTSPIVGPYVVGGLTRRPADETVDAWYEASAGPNACVSQWATAGFARTWVEGVAAGVWHSRRKR